MAADTLCDAADSLCHLWDEFGAEWTAERAQAWSSSAEFIARRTHFTAKTLEDDGVELGLLDVTTPEAAFVLAVAIDVALGDVHPRHRVAGSESFLAITAREMVSGRLNTDQQPGALRWRYRVGTESTDLEAWFPNTVRIDQSHWSALRTQTIAPESTVTDRWDPWGAELVVVCAPFVDSLDLFEIDIRGGEYSIWPKSEELAERVRDTLGVLDQSGAHLALLPEYVLDDHLVTVWRDAVEAARPPAESRLRWILIGSGPLHHASVPPNRAMLLHRRTGAILAVQDKRFGFELVPDTITFWELQDRLPPDRTYPEHLTPGEELVLLEGDRTRFAVLVCEDFDDGNHDNLLVMQAAPSHLLVPVLDRELQPGRWHEKAAGWWLARLGTSAYVANSLAVAHARRDVGDPARPVPASPLFAAAFHDTDADFGTVTDHPTPHLRTATFAPPSLDLLIELPDATHDS